MNSVWEISICTTCFLLHRSFWLKKCIDHENWTSNGENHNFSDLKMQRGEPSLKKMFFLDFDIIMGINATILLRWFQNCIKFCRAVSVSEDIGKNMPKMLKLPILWFLAHYWQFFCQYLCPGTFHRKTLYRSGISAQRRSNWYP